MAEERLPICIILFRVRINRMNLGMMWYKTVRYDFVPRANFDRYTASGQIPTAIHQLTICKHPLCVLKCQFSVLCLNPAEWMLIKGIDIHAEQAITKSPTICLYSYWVLYKSSTNIIRTYDKPHHWTLSETIHMKISLVRSHSLIRTLRRICTNIKVN